jgi:aminopeptidase Y
VAGIRKHLRAFQQIANANNGTRASGTPGYDASARYVEQQARAAGYVVTTQPFTFPYFQELAAPIFNQTAPTPTTYAPGTDFFTMEYSGSGNVTTNVQAVDTTATPTDTSTSGCEAGDFAGFVAGRIALIQRGTCTFGAKAAAWVVRHWSARQPDA